MNSKQFKRWLATQGCTFETKGRGGHLVVRRGDRKTDLPMHGSRQDLSKSLVAKVKRDLSLK